MVNLVVDRDINKLVLQTDDVTVKYLLETKDSEYTYVPYLKKWGHVEKLIKIYDKRPKTNKKTGLLEFTIGLGWTSYLLNALKDKISKETYDSILKEVLLSESYREHPFKELRDYQNEDILFLLKYKIGLMVVNTGYGKTQSIATLTNYARSLGKKVLIVTPSNKARDEIVKRCLNVFNLTVSTKDKDINGELDCIITAGLLNSLKYKDKDKRVEFQKVLAGYDWVLVDEVEYTINPGGEFVFDNCTGADHFYGFSGTADKYGAKVITLNNGLLDESVVKNTGLIKYFGPSLIYRLPLNIDISRVSIKTNAFNDLNIDTRKIEEAKNVYYTVMNEIWMNEEVCKAIVKVVKNYPVTFIPINNLNSIIDNWINTWFIGRFRVLLVSAAGYTYYNLDGSTISLTLQEACDYIKAGLVDVIPSTSSGYRALDFPGLENILLIQGKVAGVVLQSIGRVARGKHMNVITVDPATDVRIPIYTRGAEERDNLISEYYQYCNIEEIEIHEDNLEL